MDTTGDSRVDEQLQVLETLPSLPVAEHVAVFETVHHSLSEIMSTIDRDTNHSDTEHPVDNAASAAPTR